MVLNLRKAILFTATRFGFPPELHIFSCWGNAIGVPVFSILISCRLDPSMSRSSSTLSVNQLGVLFTSAGRRVGLIHAFEEAAAKLGLNLKIVACDMSPDFSAACRKADVSYSVPRCTDPDYIPSLKEICHRHAIRLIVPTIDTELEILASHKHEFEEEGWRVLVSDLSAVQVARNKMLTFERLKTAGVPVPQTWSVDEFISDVPANSPLGFICKPRDGSCSAGIRFATTKSGVLALALPENYIIQEHVKGREFTVNVFFDLNGRAQCWIPHWRKEVRGGEVSQGITERLLGLDSAILRLSAAVPGLVGPVCFQLIEERPGDYKVFEINARFGGGYPLAHAAGAEFSKWVLEETLGFPCSADNEWRDGVAMCRYDDAVYFDSFKP